MLNMFIYAINNELINSFNLTSNENNETILFCCWKIKKLPVIFCIWDFKQFLSLKVLIILMQTNITHY